MTPDDQPRYDTPPPLSGWSPPPPPDAPPPGSQPVGSGPLGPLGAVGTVRSTGTCILLTIVTLGFYTWYWYYATHEEMRRHTGAGLGGGIGLILGIFVSIVMPFLTAHEVGKLYSRRGQQPPVTAVTGLWALLLGWFFFLGAVVWFVKTNGALNAYWRSQGARG